MMKKKIYKVRRMKLPGHFLLGTFYAFSFLAINHGGDMLACPRYPIGSGV